MEVRRNRHEGRKPVEDRLNEERKLGKLKTAQGRKGKQRRHLISAFSFCSLDISFPQV